MDLCKQIPANTMPSKWLIVKLSPNHKFGQARFRKQVRIQIHIQEHRVYVQLGANGGTEVRDRLGNGSNTNGLLHSKHPRTSCCQRNTNTNTITSTNANTNFILHSKQLCCSSTKTAHLILQHKLALNDKSWS